MAAGAGSIGTGGKRDARHDAQVHVQNSATVAGRSGNGGWSRKFQAAKSVGNGVAGKGAARVCFDSFSPEPLIAIGTCR